MREQSEILPCARRLQVWHAALSVTMRKLNIRSKLVRVIENSTAKLPAQFNKTVIGECFNCSALADYGGIVSIGGTPITNLGLSWHRWKKNRWKNQHNQIFFCWSFVKTDSIQFKHSCVIFRYLMSHELLVIFKDIKCWPSFSTGTNKVFWSRPKYCRHHWHVRCVVKK